MSLPTYDIHDPRLIVADLEWLGNSFVPIHTHLIQIACYHPSSGGSFSANVRACAAITQLGDAAGAVLGRWLDWLRSLAVSEYILVAHNGVRFDSPVLLNAFRRSGVAVPPNLYMVDSLYHLRYQLRHRTPKAANYDIDSLCTLYSIPVDKDKRHTAAYDVDLLYQVLVASSKANDASFVSGEKHRVDELSVLLVHGIGPSVRSKLPTSSLGTLCDAILVKHGDLSAESCSAYLAELALAKVLPLCNIGLIAQSIEPAAGRYLQYLDKVH